MNTTHYILADSGDYRDVIKPIAQGTLDADRVVLAPGALGDRSWIEDLSGNDDPIAMFRDLLDIETSVVDPLIREPDDGLEEGFQRAYKDINAAIAAGDDVWINVTKAPPRIDHILTFIANMVASRGLDERERTHLYVSCNGVSELPLSPRNVVELSGVEADILRYLGEIESARSVSELAESMADERGVEFDGSFRSKIQYNSQKLREKGYMSKEKIGNRYEVSVSMTGRLWMLAQGASDNEIVEATVAQ